MYFEGDIKPTVKRVRPYKTLLINLPPKSFGFWVLANTKIDACYEKVEQKPDKTKVLDKKLDIADDLDDEENTIKSKRSIYSNDINLTNDLSVDFFDENRVLKNQDLRKRMNGLNDELLKVQNRFKNKRTKRQIDDFGEIRARIQNKIKHLEKARESKLKSIIGNIGHIPKRNLTRNIGGRLRKIVTINRNKILNRPKVINSKMKSKIDELDTKRNKRSTDEINLSEENEIDFSSKENMKLWTILKKMHKQLKDVSVENHQNDDIDHHDNDDVEIDDLDKPDEELTEADTNFIKSTVENLLRVLTDLNKNLSRFWDRFNILD